MFVHVNVQYIVRVLVHAMQVLILVNVVQYESPKYGDKYNYPGWALAVGWVIALLPVCLIFGWAIYYYALKGGCVVCLRL